jgi:Peptide methionine sulfoxide reductase
MTKSRAQQCIPEARRQRTIAAPIMRSRLTPKSPFMTACEWPGPGGERAIVFWSPGVPYAPKADRGRSTPRRRLLGERHPKPRAHVRPVRLKLSSRPADDPLLRLQYQARVFPAGIATRIEPGREFYPAEAYHQDYLTRNPTNRYIAVNDLPKIEDLKRLFPEFYRAAPVLVAASQPSN